MATARLPARPPQLWELLLHSPYFPSTVGKWFSPSTRREVISDVVSRKLLPPEISVEKEGFRSPTSSIRLNFRLSPFSFEILSLPVEDEFGPAMLFQFPLPPSAQNSVRYFRSKISTSPAPFSTIEQLAAQGWEIGQWSIDELKLDRSSVDGLQEQNELAKVG